MKNKINGIHHITVLATDPQKNYDFYTGILGLRLVKKTVNFDAPDVYHFYYGNETGEPGTILTFFPFPDARKGKKGTGESTAVALSIPQNSLDYWMSYFAEKAVDFNGPQKKFGKPYISLLDPDGLLIELVPDETADKLEGWSNGEIDKKHSIRKFFGATFNLQKIIPTENLLNEIMGIEYEKTDGSYKRYIVGSAENKARIDIIEYSSGQKSISGAGSVHHIAWRAENETEQMKWKTKITEAGLLPTQIIDRQYFRSIYFREPGGILFEIATDDPGFLIDEDLANLGNELKLPTQYESKRKLIEMSLMPLKTKFN